jgi:hypothetical protein
MPPDTPRRRESDDFVEYRFNELSKRLDRVDEIFATKESVRHIEEGLKDMKDAFEGLKKILIGAALSWVAGSGMFLLAVLQIRGK